MVPVQLHNTEGFTVLPGWRHRMETFSALLALCAGPSQRPVTRNSDVFFDLRLNKRLSKQSRRRWYETPSRSWWLHCNDEYWDWPDHNTVCGDSFRLLTIIYDNYSTYSTKYFASDVSVRSDHIELDFEIMPRLASWSEDAMLFLTPKLHGPAWSKFSGGMVVCNQAEFVDLF